MRLSILFAALLLASCSSPREAHSPLTPRDLQTVDWKNVMTRARGTDVSFAMWSGEEPRNALFRGPITATLKEKYGINLRIVPYSDTVEIVNKLINEKSAGRDRGGSVDMVWINGENFRLARQADVLWGPFADSLPNVAFYPDIARSRDFGTPVEGYEAPWQRAQFVLAWDTARFPSPPASLEALRQWIKSHPGRFTYIAPPDFTGSVFVRHVLLRYGDGTPAFQKFDEDHYARASSKAIAFLNDIKPYLWRKGETYPVTLRELNRLFANGEVDFSMSYGPAFASLAIDRGEFPASTRTFRFDSGTIGNYNFLAIPFNASNPPGALAVINHLISFEQLLELSQVLKNPFPLDLSKLTADQRRQVEALPRGVATLPDIVLSSGFLPEPDAAYLVRFEKDWQQQVLRK